jgi:hypothetical protein
MYKWYPFVFLAEKFISYIFILIVDALYVQIIVRVTSCSPVKFKGPLPFRAEGVAQKLFTQTCLLLAPSHYFLD